jgi:hypothetical protein
VRYIPIVSMHEMRTLIATTQARATTARAP